MITPFDNVIADIKKRGYHNHRLEDHSDIVSKGILKDLAESCKVIKEDLESNEINHWLNVPAPGARNRKIDLLISEPLQGTNVPDLDKLRICVENKSVITAHRNRGARFDDLNEALQVLHKAKPEAILIATVMIGISQQVLNVPDKIKPIYKNRPIEFEGIRKRLSSGDQSLWQEFSWAISNNNPKDAMKTLKRFQALPQRPSGYTHIIGYDFVLLVPIIIDNVNPPQLARSNPLGINIDKEYQAMLKQICKAYQARWHL